MNTSINCLLFCDHYIEDKTGKKSAIGIFNYLRSDVFPVVIPHWFVFFAGELRKGEHKFNIYIIKNGSDKSILDVNGNIVNKENSCFEIGFQLGHQVQFNEEGSYKVVLKIDEKIEAERFLSIKKIDK